MLKNLEWVTQTLFIPQMHTSTSVNNPPSKQHVQKLHHSLRSLLTSHLSQCRTTPTHNSTSGLPCMNPNTDPSCPSQMTRKGWTSCHSCSNGGSLRCYLQNPHQWCHSYLHTMLPKHRRNDHSTRRIGTSRNPLSWPTSCTPMSGNPISTRHPPPICIPNANLSPPLTRHQIPHNMCHECPLLKS
jgi:hypothetical protein